MTQSTDKGLSQTMQKAAETRVFTNAINAKKYKHKLGNPRVFIKRWGCLLLQLRDQSRALHCDPSTSLCRFLAICRTATTSNDTEKLNAEVHDFVNSDLALFKVHQTSVNLQRASADSNVGTLKQKQDELQGQILVSHLLLHCCAHAMSSSIFHSKVVYSCRR